MALAVLLGVLVIVGALSWTTPRRSVSHLSDALAAKDPAALAVLVDFEAVREGLKRQLLAHFTAAAPDERAALATSRYVGLLVDNLVTPEELVRTAGGPAPLADAKTSWRGASSFAAAMPQAGGGVTTWVFERRGLSFIVVGLELPASFAESLQREWARKLAQRPPSPEDESDLDENEARACASWRKQALATLQRLRVAQHAHHAEHDRYANDLDRLGAPSTEGPELYDYEIRASGGDGFAIEARGKGVMSGDVLVLDDAGVIRVLADRCGRHRAHGSPKGP